MKIFAIDTSGPVASVALAEDEKLIAGFRLQYKTTHSVNLMPMADLIKQLTELDMNTIDAVAVASGPGSFTGLRIGAATAKGMASALNVPVIPVPTLEGLAYRMYGMSGIICPMMDARRQQVYTGVYRMEPVEAPAVYNIRTILKGTALPIEEIAAFLNETASPTGETVHLLGDGVPVYAEKLKELLKVPYDTAPLHCDRQSAEAVAALAFRYYEAGRYTDAASFAPEYLRPSQAERVRAEKG